MRRILETITKSKLSGSDEGDLELLFFRFQRYYDRNERHKYSEVSRFIYSLDDSEIDVLTVNLKLLVEYAKDKSENDIIHKINKLIDHSDLAHYQRKYIEDEVRKNERLMRGIHRSTMTIREESKELTEELKNTKDSLENKFVDISSDIDKHKSSTYTQFVTILGIFTAITFGVFGGMEILGNVMSNIANVRISKLLMFSSLIIGAILTILYMLLTGISNLVELPIRNCGCRKTDSCNHSPFQKHPIYFIGMAASLYLFLIGVISHGYETKNLRGISILDKIMADGSGVIILSLVLFIAIMFAFYLVNRLLINKK